MSKPVVLITGSSQGIGAAIALAFARGVPGVRLALLARSKKKLEIVARACRRSGADAVSFACDASREAAVDRTASAVKRRFGTPDVLINNAGGFESARFARTTPAMFDRMLAVNLRSAFLVTRAYLPAMLRRRRGDVFFMSSVAGRVPFEGDAAYCAAKFGVAGLAKVLRLETRDSGIRVCCVYPGATWTPSWKGSGVSPDRIMPAKDVAQAFLDIWRLSRRTVVEEIVLRPQRGDV